MSALPSLIIFEALSAKPIANFKISSYSDMIRNEAKYKISSVVFEPELISDLQGSHVSVNVSEFTSGTTWSSFSPQNLVHFPGKSRGKTIIRPTLNDTHVCYDAPKSAVPSCSDHHRPMDRPADILPYSASSREVMPLEVVMQAL
jgi:hypothetical protein